MKRLVNAMKKHLPEKLSTPARRTFLRHTLLVAVGLLTASGVGLAPRMGRGFPYPLRPPGALPERDFLGNCIKCGLCVQACPVGAIKLGDINLGFGVGTPFIKAREQSCGYSCDNLSCVRACPSGALERKVTRLPKHRSRMGIAVLASPGSCLAVRNQPFEGLARGSGFDGVLRNRGMRGWQRRPLNQTQFSRPLCNLCVLECPIPRAIRMEQRIDPQTGEWYKRPVVTRHCLGCGVCEMVCPTQPASIRIVPRMKPEEMEKV